MNLVLLHDEDFVSPNCVTLRDHRAKHLRQVLNVKPGQDVRVGRLGGRLGYGTVKVLSPVAIDLQVRLCDNPPEPLPVTVIMALPRPKVCKRLLQEITAMGIKKIVLLNSWRVEKSYWQSPLLQPPALREQVYRGLEQARDTILPCIELQKRFKPFVEDILPELAEGTRALVADPQARQACPSQISGPVTLAIGPEGGFTPYEISRLQAAGLQSVHLGRRPLRVETAVPAFLGRLHPCS